MDWSITPGVYLYRDKIAATVDGRPIALQTPPGIEKDDSNFGPTAVYHDHLQARLKPGDVAGLRTLEVTYQGCAERGICYPSTTARVDLATLAVTAVGPASSPPPAGCARGNRSLLPRHPRQSRRRPAAPF